LPLSPSSSESTYSGPKISASFRFFQPSRHIPKTRITHNTQVGCQSTWKNRTSARLWVWAISLNKYYIARLAIRLPIGKS
jgi:hypothetical protein